MDHITRRNFLKLSGTVGACACGIGAFSLIESCSTTGKSVATAKPNITETADQLFFPKSMVSEKGYMLIQSRRFKEPIFATLNTDGSYTAVRLLCTHKGCTLHPAQGKLLCPCHGSEFTVDGAVTKGPAKTDLEKYSVTSDETNVYIHFA
ncbi:MAG: Rieske (2Fe-2S) protein [Chitinophagales bacterium]|nr:Rieske (2Fe-2S) protein [Chitinophagales bacterium]